MNDTSIIVLTGLITSGFTVILTKLFEILQSRNEYKIHLQKQFFERKLNYAEKTVEYLNQKAELFDRLATVFRSFYPHESEELFDKELFQSWEWISELFLGGVDEEELFKIDIPSGIWLYFNIDPKLTPSQGFNKSNLQLVKDCKKFELLIKNFEIPSKEEQERIRQLPSEEKIKWLVNFLEPIKHIQISFLKWAKLLLEARNSLQTISISIEKEFKRYK